MHHGSTGFYAKMRRLIQAQSVGKRSYLINTVWQENPSDHDAAIAKLDGLVVRGNASRADLAARHGAPSTPSLDLSYHEPIDETAPAFDWTGRIVMTDFWVENFEFAWLSADFARDWVHIDLRDISWSSLVKSLRTADLLVTGRHHAMYAAAKARLPFVLLRGNSHKYLDLLTEIHTPIPIGHKQAEILPMIAWARENRGVYGQLFDAMEARPEPDLLAERPRHCVPVTKFYAVDALAKAAEVRRDHLKAGALWTKVAQAGTPDNAATPLRHAALSYFRGGRIEDGARSLVEARGALPGRLNLVHFFPRCPQNIVGGVTEKALLFTTRFWSAPAPHLYEKGGWGEAALSAAGALQFRDDAFQAEAARMVALAKARSPIDLVAARLVLTFHLIQQNRYALAEEFWVANEPDGRPQWETIEDDFRVFSRTAPFSDRTRAARDALAHQLTTEMRKRTDLRFALIEHDWWTRLPDRARAEDAVAHARAAPSDLAIFEAALCSCIEAGEIDLAVELSRKAKPAMLLAVAQKNAAVAAFARDAALLSPDDAVDFLAGFMQRSRQIEQELIERLSNPARSLAMVGNAPSELGRGSGALIDQRDEVVRFNRFRIGGEWAKDYGSRVTVVFTVIAMKDALKHYSYLPKGTILCFMPCKRRFMERSWQRVAELEAAGFRVCFPFMNALGELGRELGAWPSTGLMILYRLKSIRSQINRSEIFGFSSGPDESGRYAYDSPRRGNDIHDWARERETLQAILSE